MVATAARRGAIVLPRAADPVRPEDSLGSAEPPAVVVTHVEPGRRLRLDGRVDVRTVAEVRVALHAAVDHGVGELVVDVARAELRDTTGLGALLGAHRRAQRCGRSLVLVNVPATLARLLAATRLTRVLRTRAEVGGDLDDQVTEGVHIA